ncbi:hypothetical protein D3C71_1826060 [compost metagenome]
MQHLRIHVHQDGCQQPARQSADRAGNQEGDLLEALHVIAQLAGSDLVLAYARDGPPEG